VTPLLQLVPRLRPLVCGTGDFALTLARGLREAGACASSFLVLEPGWAGPGQVDGFPARRLAALEGAALIAALEAFERDAVPGPCPVLLHYENYAYARRGVPLWLVSALARWRARGGGRRLLTVFHSLYARNAPWNSSFWLAPAQKALAARLRRLSDGAVAIGREDALRLARWGGSARSAPAVVGVASPVGEPRETAPLAERERRLVVFGREWTRLAVYRRRRRELLRACAGLAIREVADVGPPIPLPDLPGLKLGARGALPEREVGALLAGSTAGFFAYAHAKSSVLAAYLAHGMLAVAGAAADPAGDGPVAGQHYWACVSASPAPASAEAQRIADGGARWYREHSHSSLATRALADLVRAACR
jgi:hypothetical protein